MFAAFNQYIIEPFRESAFSHHTEVRGQSSVSVTAVPPAGGRVTVSLKDSKCLIRACRAVLTLPTRPHPAGNRSRVSPDELTSNQVCGTQCLCTFINS